MGACRALSEEVQKEMLNIVAGLQVKLMKNTRTLTQLKEETDCEIEKRKWDEGGGGSNIFKKSRITTQTTINTILKKNVREEACFDICSFMSK